MQSNTSLSKFSSTGISFDRRFWCAGMLLSQVQVSAVGWILHTRRCLKTIFQTSPFCTHWEHGYASFTRHVRACSAFGCVLCVYVGRVSVCTCVSASASARVWLCMCAWSRCSGDLAVSPGRGHVQPCMCAPSKVLWCPLQLTVWFRRCRGGPSSRTLSQRC